MDKAWDGVDRRRKPTAEEVAVVLDAEKLSAGRYRRHRIYNTLLAVVAGVVVAIPVSIIVGSDIKGATLANSQRNCAVQAAGRPVGNGRDFAERQLLRVANDFISEVPAKFRNAETDLINRELHAVEHYRLATGVVVNLLGPHAPTHVNGFTDLRGFLDYLPPIDCSTVVQ